MIQKINNNILNPFVGLRPFHDTESHLFFGRDRYINEIRRKLDRYHFVSVVGNSGSGKSSLVRAGVLPGLWENEEWIVCVMRPGKEPVKELCYALLSKLTIHTDNNKQIEESLHTLYKSKAGLVQLMRSRIPQGKKLLIVADQFEELFRFASEDRYEEADQFVSLLLTAINQQDVPIYLMITLRSDFIGDCEQFYGLPEAINKGQFLVPRMNREELQSTITEPVALAGGKIAPALVQRLMSDVGRNPDQLPVLQHVLMRTWEVWKKENDMQAPIDMRHYQQTGMMAKALSNHAEEAIEDINTERKRAITSILFKTLTVKEAENRGVRRPTSVAAVAAIAGVPVQEVIDVADIFRRHDRGFLMPPDTMPLNADTILDISHESLMRVWERLAEWTDEEMESANLYKRICENALLYEKGLAGLWQDPDLQVALEWKEKQQPNEHWARQYNEHFQLAVHFIEASLQHKRFLQADKKRRQRILQVAVIIIFVALSSLTLWAFTEQKASRKNEQKALAEKKNALKQEQIAGDKKAEAEKNLLIANKQTEEAQRQKAEAEKQKKIALLNAEEAKQQETRAESSFAQATEARQRAENEKQAALMQKTISDSLKGVAENSEQHANRLHMLSLAQNLAIKSGMIKPENTDKELKSLLALYARQYQQQFAGKSFDPEIYHALFSAYRTSQQPSDYISTANGDIVRAVIFNHKGNKTASVSVNGMLVLSGAGTGKQQVIFPKQSLILDQPVFSEDDKMIACTGDDNSILIFDAGNSNAAPRKISGLHQDKISGMAWSGTKIVTVSRDRNINIIDATKGTLIRSFSINKSTPSCMAWHAAADRLFIGCDDGNVYSVVVSGDKQPELLRSTAGQIKSMALSSDGNNIACGTAAGNILLFPATGNATPQSIAAHNATVTALAFIPGKNELASASLDGTVKIWNLSATGDAPIVFSEHESWVFALSCSPDGALLASCGKDKTVRYYRLDERTIASDLSARINRDLSPEEWKQYIGTDIPYSPIIKQQ